MNDDKPEIGFNRPCEDTTIVRLAGSWKIESQLPSTEEVRRHLEEMPAARRLSFDTRELTGWDTGLLTFLINAIRDCSGRNIDVDKTGLPAGVRRLLNLAMAVPEKKDARPRLESESFLARVGGDALAFVRSSGELISFVGEAPMVVAKLFIGKARFRSFDFKLFLQESGAQALPIVSLICFLVGLILAFVGIVQLKLFGARVYVADLVDIAMVREMGAIMTGSTKTLMTTMMGQRMRRSLI